MIKLFGYVLMSKKEYNTIILYRDDRKMRHLMNIMNLLSSDKPSTEYNVKMSDLESNEGSYKFPDPKVVKKPIGAKITPKRKKKKVKL